LSTDAEREREGWAALVDSLLAGIGHTLNNRVATLRALVSLVGDGAGRDYAALLERETDLLERMVGLLRLLPARRGASPVPLLVPGVVESAMELFRQLDVLRDLRVAEEIPAGLPPVLAEEGALLRLVLLLLAAAGRSALATDGGEVFVRVEGDDRWVTLTVGPRPGPVGTPDSTGLDSAEAERLASLAGGELAAPGGNGGASVLRLPTLAAARAAGR